MKEILKLNFYFILSNAKIIFILIENINNSINSLDSIYLIVT